MATNLLSTAEGVASAVHTVNGSVTLFLKSNGDDAIPSNALVEIALVDDESGHTTFETLTAGRSTINLYGHYDVRVKRVRGLVGVSYAQAA